MIVLKTRSIGSCLLWLFLVAQTGSIIPLFSIHLKHVFASQLDIAEDIAAGSASDHVHHHHAHNDDHGDGQHDHGADDPNDQCCTLHHHLTGVLPHAIAAKTNGFLIVATASLPPRLLVNAEQRQLERPPKLLLSI